MLVEHAHEARLAALVGALRPAVGVGRREEEHVARLDERAVAVVDPVVEDALVEPVGEPPRVEAVLQLAAGGAVEAHVQIFSGKPNPGQTIGAQNADQLKGRCGERPFFYDRGDGLSASQTARRSSEWEERPPGLRASTPRQAADVTTAAGLKQSRGRVWRYPAGTRGRRHADKAQEEVFVVISGTMTMLLGEPPERVDVGLRASWQSSRAPRYRCGTKATQELVLYIYGAPPEQEGADFFDDVEL